MKKILSFILLSVLSISLAQAKKVKQPDSYAYNRGVEAYDDENYDDAIDWFNREISENPDNGYAFVYISAIRYKNDENGKAISAIEQALKKLPKKDKEWNAIAHGYRANIYCEMGDTASALADLATSIKLEPEELKYRNVRAQLNFELGDYAASDDDYSRMTQINPGDLMGYMGLGRNANAQGRYDEAVELFSHVAKLYPDYSSAYSFRAQTYVNQEKWNEATDDILKALDIDGDDKAYYMLPTLPEKAANIMKTKLKVQAKKEPANVYWPYCLGTLAEANENYAEAIDFYQQANKLDANTTLLDRISRCYVSMGNLDKALATVNQIFDMEPDNHSMLMSRAAILSKMGRFDESIADYSAYIDQYPSLAFSYLSRAEDLMSAHRFDEAIEDYTTATVILPIMEESTYLLMKRGDAYRLSGKKELAEADYKMLIDLENDSVDTESSYTPFALTGLGENQKAIELMKGIVESDTTDLAGALYNLACIYARAGENTLAVATLKECVENGYDNYVHIMADYDLDELRDMPEFIELTESIAPKKADEADDEAESKDFTYEVVEVPFTREGGVTKVQCAINELPLHFVFDTGAADVTISMVEANFMLKNNYIKPTDFIGSDYYVTADGNVVEGSVINLRKVDFGGLELENVRASVVRNQHAPLLLGQSVLGRLGKVEIDNSESKLKITHRIEK